MFHTRKRLLGAAVVGALALSLVACAGGGSGGATPSGSAVEVPDQLTIGFVGSLTGPLAASGINSLAGLKAGAEYAETLHEGMTIEVVERDTAGEATAAVAQTRELAQAGVTAIFFTTEAFPAVQDVLNQVKIPGGTSGGIAAVLSEVGDSNRYKYAFSTGAGNAGETAVTPLLDYVSSFGDKIGLVEDASAFAVAQADLTEEIVAEDYPDLELVRTSFPASASDATAQLSSLQEADVHAVVMWPYGTPAVTVMSSFDKLGWYPPTAGTLGLGTPAIVEATPEKLAENLAAGPMATTFLDPALDTTGIHEEFVTRYLEALDKTEFTPLDTVGANSFDWSVLIAQAVADTGKTDGDSIKNFLTSGEEFIGANGVYVFGPDKRIGIDADGLQLYRSTEPCSSDGFCVPIE
jgi:branched-chain amino acid transport system substrate-binding protein